MSIRSIRTVEVPQTEKQVDQKTASASTLQELINTIPQAYRVQLGDYLTKKYRVAHKHANVQSTVTTYEHHATDGTFPPIIRNALKEPKLQFAKEFLSTKDGTEAPTNFRNAVTVARSSALTAAIKEKRAELACLAKLIKADEPDWRTRVYETATNIAQGSGGKVKVKEGHITCQDMPTIATEEINTLQPACGSYTYRCLALARASIDRTDLQKSSKKKVKVDTDVKMTGVDDRNQGVADLVSEQIQSLRKDLMAKILPQKGKKSTPRAKKPSPAGKGKKAKRDGVKKKGKKSR